MLTAANSTGHSIFQGRSEDKFLEGKLVDRRVCAFVIQTAFAKNALHLGFTYSHPWQHMKERLGELGGKGKGSSIYLFSGRAHRDQRNSITGLLQSYGILDIPCHDREANHLLSGPQKESVSGS